MPLCWPANVVAPGHWTCDRRVCAVARPTARLMQRALGVNLRQGRAVAAAPRAECRDPFASAPPQASPRVSQAECDKLEASLLTKRHHSRLLGRPSRAAGSRPSASVARCGRSIPLPSLRSVKRVGRWGLEIGTRGPASQCVNIAHRAIPAEDRSPPPPSPALVAISACPAPAFPSHENPADASIRVCSPRT